MKALLAQAVAASLALAPLPAVAQVAPALASVGCAPGATSCQVSIGQTTVWLSTKPPATSQAVAVRMYTPGVIAAGLQAEQDLALPGATGPRHAPTLRAGVDPLPACARITRDRIDFTASCSLFSWDLRGYWHQIDNNSSVMCVACLLGDPTAPLYLINIGGNSGSNRFTCVDCDIDQTNVGQAGDIKSAPGNALTLQGTYLHGASVDFLNLLGDSDVSWSFFTAPAQNLGRFIPPDPRANHCEAAHFLGGHHVWAHVLVDATIGAANVKYGCSAIVFAGAFPPGVSVVLDRSIVRGATATKTYSTLAVSSSSAPVAWSVTNSSIEHGPSLYASANGLPGMTGYNNFDDTTGQPITALWK